MAEGNYNQFCPIAMASEILCTRWTLLILRELLAGSTRFNELRRGVQRMSPALLSKRLKDLAAAGIVTRSKVTGEPELFEYQLSKAGLELAPVIDGVGAWGHRWIKTEASLKNLDVNLLMWGIRGDINPDPMPARRTTIQVIFTDLQAGSCTMAARRILRRCASGRWSRDSRASSPAPARDGAPSRRRLVSRRSPRGRPECRPRRGG